MTNPNRITLPRGRGDETVFVTWTIMDHENPHPNGARRYAKALRILEELGTSHIPLVTAITSSSQTSEVR